LYDDFLLILSSVPKLEGMGMPKAQELNAVSLDVLCSQLRNAASELDGNEAWPKKQLSWCAESGVFRWFIDRKYDGWNWTEKEIIEGYLALSQNCMTTTFVLTQWQAACRRIAGCSNETLRDEFLPKMATGELIATVGISHLTTSRQHMGRPVLVADRRPDGSYLLNGFSAWVTGGAYADLLVIGATQADGNQILCALPRLTQGVTTYPGQRLVALTSSCTDRVTLENVLVQPQQILAGPTPNVLQSGAGGGAGGLQTSTLAVGLSMAAAKFLMVEAKDRPGLVSVASAIDRETEKLRKAIVNIASGSAATIPLGELRSKANSLVLRSTQAALTVAKGAGFAADHPVGRWAREALFFLVWSCPQPVLDTNLRELSQTDDDCPVV
jgi:alkylation response protein AidB-like acyl-CoA dehydrogenase